MAAPTALEHHLDPFETTRMHWSGITQALEDASAPAKMPVTRVSEKPHPHRSVGRYAASLSGDDSASH